MRFFAGLWGVFLLVALCNASVVQRRTYRNTEEILVPVTIIQDGEEIKEPANLKETEKEAELKNIQPLVIAENIVAAAEEAEKVAEQNLETVEAVVQAQRRIDEAIVEEEIGEAIKEEQEQEKEQENKLKTTLADEAQIVAVQEPVEKTEEAAANLKSAAISASIPEEIVELVEGSENANSVNDESQQSDGAERQATQATPTQTTTQQNFVQQLIQNSPLGQFFNQLTGQSTPAPTNNDDATSAPGLPGILNPITAAQTAAQSFVNTTTQAFQGLQQFASNLGNQFQNTLSGLGGQPATGDATTARPPGPIQQLVNTFIPQQAQPVPAPQGPLQGLLNIFQGNNRPATSNADNANTETQPAKEPEIQEAQSQAAVSAETTDQAANEVRESGEAGDSFEESVQPEELIVVNDDARQAVITTEQETTSN